MEISFGVICTCSHIDFIMLLFDYIVVDFKIFSQLCYVLKALLAIHIGQMTPSGVLLCGGSPRVSRAALVEE